MASFEDSYKSQLQGVSQQVARERLDGQVSAQDNMLSDTVTNLRRRPGAEFMYSLSIPNATSDSLLSWDTDLGGTQVTLILNIVDGVIRVLNSGTYALLATLPASAYLTASTVGEIQAATVGDEFFLCNVKKQPALDLTNTVIDPTYRGMFYVKAGAYSKTYEVKVQSTAGSAVATYTTPNGATAGDAALATPENIATNLVNSINAATSTTGITAVRDASFVYLYTTAWGVEKSLACTTPSGSNYIIASGASYLRQESDLPSRLPSQADGYILATGEPKAPRYYRYDHAKMAWLETGNYGAPAKITNVPVSVTYQSGSWVLLTTEFEGRYAGDNETNPNPDFIARGITGMASYQGRLVLLAGSMVNMSAALKPRRFYRTTVTSILDSDPISVGASAASAAAFQYAVPFQKDLLLFSAKYQAVVPGGNVAISPRTAAVVVTSTYNADMTSCPTTVGRTLMYPAPRSKQFFGLLEMLPSTQTEAQYTSFDSTAHLPKYMAGRCRFGVSSSVANMVLFAPTGERNALIVHEYTWSGEEKVQAAWHKWTFKYEIATAFFSGQTVVVQFVKNGVLVACSIDPRQGSVTEASQRRPYLDISQFVDVVDNVVTQPSWLLAFDPAALSSVKLSVAEGPLAGENVGFTIEGSVMRTVRSFPNGKVSIGFPFRSTFSPTPPMVKDANGVKISANKLTLLRFMLGTNNSMQYVVSVRDAATSADAGEGIVGTLRFSSAELELGAAREGADSVAVIPCRTDANSTSLVVHTEGAGELNLVSLEYVARYHQKIRRRQV